MAQRESSRMHPPLGIDPEYHLSQRETLDQVLDELGHRRFGHAFIARALDERPWQELAADLGVEPNTLTKAWTRQIERLRQGALGEEEGRA